MALCCEPTEPIGETQAPSLQRRWNSLRSIRRIVGRGLAPADKFFEMCKLGLIDAPDHLYKTVSLLSSQAISRAISIMVLKEVCRSADVVVSPVIIWSEMVQIASAFFPARAALA